MDLSSFFRENAIKTEEVKFVVSKRFLDKKKEPVEWILRPVSSQKDEEIRNAIKGLGFENLSSICMDIFD